MELPDLAVAMELTDSFEDLRLRSKFDFLLLSEGVSEGLRAGNPGDCDGRLGGSPGLCKELVEVRGGRAGREA